MIYIYIYIPTEGREGCDEHQETTLTMMVAAATIISTDGEKQNRREYE